MKTHRPRVTRLRRDGQWGATCPDCGWVTSMHIRKPAFSTVGVASWRIVRNRANAHHSEQQALRTVKRPVA